MSDSKLRLEVTAQLHGLTNALDTRRRHPTFGVTKAELWRRLHNLEGLLYAWLLVTQDKRSASFYEQAREASELLEIDLTAIRIAIKQA